MLVALLLAPPALGSDPDVSALQEALGVEVTGEWDQDTREAMQTLQEDNDLVITEFPSVETLVLLEIDPTLWSPIMQQAGAPRSWIDEATQQADRLLASPSSATALEVATGSTCTRS
jgi:hypothetical protein